MMLVGPSLRVVPITTHIALKEVPEALSIELIKARALATAKGLQKNFAIHSPRLVIAGLNPHAGEDGALGMEEIDIDRKSVGSGKSVAVSVDLGGVPIIKTKTKSKQSNTLNI